MPTRPRPRSEKRKVFILRIWPHGRDEMEWVSEIQEVSTGVTAHVYSLEALFDWLKEKTTQTLDASQDNNSETPGEQKFTLRI